MNRRVATALVLTLALAGGARAQQQALPRDLWPQAAASARAADYPAAKKATADLLSAGRGYGIRTYPLYAASAAALARQAQQQGNKELTAWAVAAANQLDPRSPAVAFSESDRAADQNNPGRSAQLAVSGFSRALRNYRTGVLSRADIVYLLVAALVVAAIVFALVLFIRYGRSMAHDFREILGKRFRGGSVTVLAFALLFLPIFLWLGPMWLVFYWFAIFFGYADRDERVLIVVICVLIAFAPLMLDHASHSVAGVDSPVIVAAISGVEQSYHPEALRRLQEVVNVVPDNPTLEILLGNLHLFEGNDQEARVHYRRSADLKNSAGAHVNLGNLHFFNNEYSAANNEYQEAQRLDPKMAIAFYNNSVAAGDMFNYAQQQQMLGEAQKIDADLIEQLRRETTQRVITYRPTIREAWRVANAIESKPAVRSQFGAYAALDPAASLLNPVTIGATLALLLGVLLHFKRRVAGYAGACIKCGRTFCYRCKSARDSATYCTQCIHIYLKRDGVSLETKRQKLDEVSEHHSSVIRRNRFFATFLPGSGQLLDGRTTKGIIGLFLFALFVATAILVGHLAPALGPSASAAHFIVRIAAIAIAVIIWFVLTLPVYRRRTAG